MACIPTVGPRFESHWSICQVGDFFIILAWRDNLGIWNCQEMPENHTICYLWVDRTIWNGCASIKSLWARLWVYWPGSKTIALLVYINSLLKQWLWSTQHSSNNSLVAGETWMHLSRECTWAESLTWKQSASY